ncbi:MAG: CdaR family protein [Erysipelotrichaceae bacterium]
MAKQKIEKQNRQSEDKLELAKRIASQSQRVARTYENIENSVIRGVRWFSSAFDRILFNRFSKTIALVLALLMYVFINYNLGEVVFQSTITAGGKIENIPVTVIANDEVYEISGLPTSVNALLVGDYADIQLVKTQRSYTVVADLTGLLEGTHEVTLTPKDFSERVDVVLQPSTAVVTIKKKISQQFNVGYDFVNTDKMNQEYELGKPTFDTTEVIIRAAQSTIEKIGNIKALINVTGVQSSFTQEAPLVAYDQQGNRMNVDIIPSTVNVNVTVTNPNKSVPVVIVPQGDIPNGKAIESIALDQQAVTLYASDEILQSINSIQIPINVTTLTSDTVMVAEVNLPSGVRKSSVTRVSLSIKLGDAVTRTIAGLPIDYRNNVNGYNFTLTVPAEAYANVDLIGTKTNTDAVTADDISIYIDMKDVKLGTQTVNLYIVGTNNLVRFTLQKQTISIKVTK